MRQSKMKLSVACIFAVIFFLVSPSTSRVIKENPNGLKGIDKREVDFRRLGDLDDHLEGRNKRGADDAGLEDQNVYQERDGELNLRSDAFELRNFDSEFPAERELNQERLYERDDNQKRESTGLFNDIKNKRAFKDFINGLYFRTANGLVKVPLYFKK